MSYTQIRARVIDQTLQLTHTPKLASGNVDVVQIAFDFCSLWSGYGKIAVFYRDEGEVYHIPVVDSVATVPHEVLEDEGCFFFGVMGAGDNTRTTEVLQVFVAQGAITSATAEHEDPTPEIYQQLLAAYAILEARFNNILTAGTPEDSELADLRVDYYGATHDSAGNAVRSQFAKAIATLVSYNENTGRCNWNASEILTMTNQGRSVVFHTGDLRFIPLTYVDRSVARFDRITTDEAGDTVRESLTIDNDGILTNTYAMLATQDALADMIDDTTVGAQAWSSKNTIDKLCPSFTETAALVTCEPVEGYPLEVASINLAGNGATSVTRCGKNLFDKSESKLSRLSYNSTSGNKAEIFGFEFILPPGTYVLKAQSKESAKEGYIYGLTYDSSGKYTGEWNAVWGTDLTAKIKTFTDVTRVIIYDAINRPDNGAYMSYAWATFDKWNIQLEVGNTATAYEPYNGETFELTAGNFLSTATVPALPGVNNILADTGEVTVTGRADPAAIIRDLYDKINTLQANAVNNV